MAKEHSFFIPDMENVSDLEGLLKFLGVKVGAYNVCLWCSSKCYRDLQSVQKHMFDKGHQKMKFEGETLLEYTDFYEYEGDASIDEEEYDVANDLEITTISRVTSSTFDNSFSNDGEDAYEIVLPSGAKIGHRSLFKYYKQSFGHRNLELKQKNNLTVRDKYKAIGSNQNYSGRLPPPLLPVYIFRRFCSFGLVYYNILKHFKVTDIQKQRKDLAYLQRWKSNWHTKLGWQSNKLQKHFRRQDLTF
jgi:hypothetical protein